MAERAATALINTTEELPAVAAERAINVATWNALKTSVFPGASDASVAVAYDYCRARALDPLQKPVHIVPMYVDGAMRDVIMPGIGLYRIQAARSGSLAGMDEPVFGPMVEQTWTKPGKNRDEPGRPVTVTYPQWCKYTVHKLIGDRIVAFVATVYWLEEYATASRWTDCPNDMWAKRPFGQLAKCAEAQALRRGWPEIDQGPTAEEMQGKHVIDGTAARVDEERPPASAYDSRTEALTERMREKQQPAETAPEEDPPDDGGEAPGVDDEALFHDAKERYELAERGRDIKAADEIAKQVQNGNRRNSLRRARERAADRVRHQSEGSAGPSTEESDVAPTQAQLMDQLHQTMTANGVDALLEAAHHWLPQDQFDEFVAEASRRKRAFEGYTTEG